MKRPRFALFAFVGTFLGLCLLGLPPSKQGTAADPTRGTSYGYDEYGYEDYAYEDFTVKHAEGAPAAALNQVSPEQVSAEATDAVAGECADDSIAVDAIAPFDDPTALESEELTDDPCDPCHPDCSVPNHDATDLCEEYDAEFYECGDRLARDLADLRLLEILADDRHSYGNDEILDLNLEQEGLTPPAPQSSVEENITHEAPEEASVCPIGTAAPADGHCDGTYESPEYSGYQSEYGHCYGGSDTEYRNWLDKGILPYALPQAAPREETPRAEATNEAGESSPGHSEVEDCDLEYLHYPRAKDADHGEGNGESSAGMEIVEENTLQETSLQATGQQIENNVFLNDAVEFVYSVGRSMIEWTGWLTQRVREELPSVEVPPSEAGISDADIGL